MYTVGTEDLPEADRTAEAVEIMKETLADIAHMPHIAGLHFTGEVLQDTNEPDRFTVACYSGLITSLVTEPPTFNLLVDDAWRQIAECDCPEGNVDLIFENFGQAMEGFQIAQDLEEFSGAPTTDPHLEPIRLEPNTEITIRFDRLGAYGVSGMVRRSGPEISSSVDELYRYCREFTEYYMSHTSNIVHDEHRWAVVYWPPESGDESLTIWKDTLDHVLVASYKCYENGVITKNASPRDDDLNQDPAQEYVLENREEAQTLVGVLQAALPWS